ncbi:GFA family protein [Rhizobium sp. TH2]|uniref:GFA family protein n=1 Tax=Rhizobium sp. TH2 TaxID=2775403 RepID=UPI0035BE9B03
MLKGSCHCGGTKFEVAEAPKMVIRCTCSICSKRGALWAYYEVKSFKLLTSPENVASYRWHTKTISHNFCPVCGCGTFTETPDWSTGEANFDNPQIAINARLFDDFNLDAVPVEVIDGKNQW